MVGYKVRLLIFSFMVGLYLSLSHPFYPAFATNDDSSDAEKDITIETEIGPGFKDTDSEQIEACSLNVFANKFPLDFVQAPPIRGNRTCPALTMFGMTHQACFILDVFESIEPGIIATMFILAIMSL